MARRFSSLGPTVRLPQPGGPAPAARRSSPHSPVAPVPQPGGSILVARWFRAPLARRFSAFCRTVRLPQLGISASFARRFDTRGQTVQLPQLGDPTPATLRFDAGGRRSTPVARRSGSYSSPVRHPRPRGSMLAARRSAPVARRFDSPRLGGSTPAAQWFGTCGPAASPRE